MCTAQAAAIGKPSEEKQSVQRRIIESALIALVFMACASLSVAAGTSAAAVQVPASQANAVSKKAAPPARPKQLVDINSASREKLKTLPGIGSTEADKIVAGRPYLSKADLVTKNAIPAGTYLSIKRMIIAKQKAKPSGKG